MLDIIPEITSLFKWAAVIVGGFVFASCATGCGVATNSYTGVVSFAPTEFLRESNQARIIALKEVDGEAEKQKRSWRAE